MSTGKIPVVRAKVLVTIPLTFDPEWFKKEDGTIPTAQEIREIILRDEGQKYSFIEAAVESGNYEFDIQII